MIYFSRTSSVMPGKLGEGLAFAHEVADYIGKTQNVDVKVVTPLGGNPFRITWLAQYDSLADYEKMRDAQATDPGYAAVLQKSVGMFIAGSAHDQLWKSA